MKNVLKIFLLCLLCIVIPGTVVGATENTTTTESTIQ